MDFSIIACVDTNNGIGINQSIPWLESKEYSDLGFFKKTTQYSNCNTRQNCIIMGRNTWNSLPKKPLPSRINIVISKTLKQDNGYYVFNNLDMALDYILNNLVQKVNKVFVVGGEILYREAIVHPKCREIIMTRVPKLYDCNKFFPEINFNFFIQKSINYKDDLTFIYYIKNRQINLEEYQYLSLIKNIISNGCDKNDRTGVGTVSIWGNQMRFNLENNTLPLLTTKKVYTKGIIEELLWFLRGSTNSKTLSQKGVKIWDPNGSREFLDQRGFKDRSEGDLGPVYGFQWRHWGASYQNCETNYKDKGIDQINKLINDIKENPDSRRHILSSWNVADIDKMALPPCHVLFQFYVNDNKLSGQLYQRSGDVGLGVPFNIASYSLLIIIIAHLTNTTPFELVYTLGDAHIYKNHIEPLKTQLTRWPKDFPKITLKNKDQIKSIEDLTYESFVIRDYAPDGPIKMKMAV